MFFGLTCHIHILGTELWLLKYTQHCLIYASGWCSLVLGNLELFESSSSPLARGCANGDQLSVVQSLSRVRLFVTL